MSTQTPSKPSQEPPGRRGQPGKIIPANTNTGAKPGQRSGIKAPQAVTKRTTPASTKAVAAGTGVLFPSIQILRSIGPNPSPSTSAKPVQAVASAAGTSQKSSATGINSTFGVKSRLVTLGTGVPQIGKQSEVPKTRIPSSNRTHAQIAAPVSKSGADDGDMCRAAAAVPSNPLHPVVTVSTNGSLAKESICQAGLPISADAFSGYSAQVPQQIVEDMALIIRERDETQAARNAEKKDADERLAKMSGELVSALRDVELLNAKVSEISVERSILLETCTKQQSVISENSVDLFLLSAKCKEQQTEIYTQKVEILGPKTTLSKEQESAQAAEALLARYERKPNKILEEFMNLGRDLMAEKNASISEQKQLALKEKEIESWKVAQMRQQTVDKLQQELVDKPAIVARNELLEKQLANQKMRADLMEATSGGATVQRLQE